MKFLRNLFIKLQKKAREYDKHKRGDYSVDNVIETVLISTFLRAIEEKSNLLFFHPEIEKRILDAYNFFKVEVLALEIEQENRLNKWANNNTKKKKHFLTAYFLEEDALTKRRDFYLKEIIEVREFL